jgi:hypothetical protein
MIWMPLSLLILCVVAVWVVNYWYMSREAALWEVGMGIRARFTDFSHDFLEGKEQAVAAYYATEFRGQGFGYETRRPFSEEGGIRVEEWTAADGSARNREQMLAELVA